MAKFRLLAPMFIAPNLFPAGSVIDYVGPVNIQMEPLDDVAEKALVTYIKENPHALAHPTEGLARTMGEEVVATTAELVSPPPRAPIDPLAPTAAAPGKAKPGVTDGGTIPPVVVAPSQLPSEIASGITGGQAASIAPDNPAAGDPTKPGEKGTEFGEAKKEADAAAAAVTEKPSTADLKVK